MLAIIAAMTMLAIPIAIDEAHAEPQADVVHIEGRSYLFSAGIDGEVTWDFGDGTVVRSSEAVAHSFPSSGLWTVTVTDSSRTYDLQVMIIDQSPPTKCYTGSEYRWAPDGEVTYVSAREMVTGDVATWLTWDEDSKSICGTPPTSAVGMTYLVRAVIDGVGVAYDLKILAGASAPLSANFTTTAEDLTVTVEPISSPNIALWSWSMYDMGGKIVSIDAGRPGTLTAPMAGDYIVRATVSSASGAAEYSKLISLSSEPLDADDDEIPTYWYVVGIACLIALLMVVRYL